MTGVFYISRKLDRDKYQRKAMRRRREKVPSAIKGQSPQNKLTCQHLDLGLPASRMLRKQIPMV
jgi:hypothetical protein